MHAVAYSVRREDGIKKFDFAQDSRMSAQICRRESKHLARCAICRYAQRNPSRGVASVEVYIAHPALALLPVLKGEVSSAPRRARFKRTQLEACARMHIDASTALYAHVSLRVRLTLFATQLGVNCGTASAQTRSGRRSCLPPHC